MRIHGQGMASVRPSKSYREIKYTHACNDNGNSDYKNTYNKKVIYKKL